MIRRQPASVKSQLNSIEPELMSQSDEPLFDQDDIAHGPVPASDPAVRVRIRHLLDEQPYAVLCVQGGGQPYGALVAVAFSEDLQHAVFSTPIETRKYRLLSQCSHVALVIDDRSKKADVSLRFEALVLQGRLQNISTTGVDSRGLDSRENATSCQAVRTKVVRLQPVGWLRVIGFASEPCSPCAGQLRWPAIPAASTNQIK